MSWAVARDIFAAKCKALSLQEWHLWGKAELEDRLFQPASDHLLFAYFGFSLTIRRRSQRADLRAKLAMKRKVSRILGSRSHEHVLLRSPDATAYPYSGDVPNFAKRPLWILRRYDGLRHNGALFCIRRHFAFLSDDGQEWDAVMIVNDAFSRMDRWRTGSLDEIRTEEELRGAAWQAWGELPEANRAWLEVVAIVPFENILDIDELGDEFIEAPHVYVPFDGRRGPFVRSFNRIASIVSWNSRERCLQDLEDGRVAKFSAEFRKQREGG